MAIFGIWPLIAWTAGGVAWRVVASNDPLQYAELVAVLAAVAVAARWNAVRLAKSDEAHFHFEQEMPPVLQTLGLRFEPTNHPSG